MRQVASRLNGSESVDAQFEAARRMMLGGGATMVYHLMAEDDVIRIMRNPWVSIASDSGVLVAGQGVPHPRGYGNNARVLGEYIHARHVLSLEEAIRKMTSMPAETFPVREARAHQGRVHSRTSPSSIPRPSRTRPRSRSRMRFQRRRLCAGQWCGSDPQGPAHRSAARPDPRDHHRCEIATQLSDISYKQPSDISYQTSALAIDSRRQPADGSNPPVVASAFRRKKAAYELKSLS